MDKRLARALEEKDDIQQECNSATRRSKVAETRVTSLKERCGTKRCFHRPQSETHRSIAKLQAQVGRLREDLEVQRSYRQELSNEILSEARSRLQHLQHLVGFFLFIRISFGFQFQAGCSQLSQW